LFLGFLLFAVTHAAEEAVKMGCMVDDINAYSYAYPLELPSEKLVFKWYYLCLIHERLDLLMKVLPNSSNHYSLNVDIMQG